VAVGQRRRSMALGDGEEVEVYQVETEVGTYDHKNIINITNITNIIMIIII
jgi:hypothetical protein